MARVAITGIGLVSPLGNDKNSALSNAAAGRSAIRRLDADWCRRLSAPLGACVRFDPERHFDAPKLRMLDRASQLALVAARQAAEDARLEPGTLDRERCGVFFGCAQGGSGSTDEGYRTLYAEQCDRFTPFSVLMAMTNAPAAWIGIEYGFTGANLTYSTACSSSAVSIGEAALRVGRRELDLVLAGGAEAPLCFGSMKAWEAMHTLAHEDARDPSRSCKPFAHDRSGLVLGEGAAVLVLEEWERAVGRGATPYGELAGYGLVTDAAHITRPTVVGQAAAMRAALHSANCPAGAIDSINAHGTGTPANDGVETAAIKQVFGAHAYRVPISGTKAMHGHLLGASGALELALSLLAMQRQILLPTMHLQQPAPDCDLDYVPNEARHGVSIGAVMSNSFAFGGVNASLIARAPPAASA